MTRSVAIPSPRQIPLDLPWPRHDRAERSDFHVSESNAEAVGFIDHCQAWPESRMVLTGPEGCGKTHLALIWAKEAGARFIDDETLTARDISSARRVILEDCDRRITTLEQENALFHLLNILREEGGSILLTARTSPARWPIRLPDLASRLNAVSVAKVHPPDDALLEFLVAKLFSDRDILVNPALASYIAKRIERNAAAVESAVARLDAASLESGTAPSIKMAKDVLGW